MTTKLVAGKIEKTTGQPDHLTADSMAAAIDAALTAVFGAPRPGEDPHGRFVMAAAVARGVVQYLHDKHDALHVKTRNFSGTGSHEESVTVEVDVT